MFPVVDIAVSVRTLCHFTARSGDLDLRFTPSPSGVEGTAGQQTVTARRGAGYQRELSLSPRFGPLVVRGRADGFDPVARRVEEIKTRRGDAGHVPANHQALHWAQARVYGWMLREQLSLAQIEVALVYFDLDSGQETVLTKTCTADALRAFFEDLCERYFTWAWAQQLHRHARDEALSALAFPFPSFRTGQRELAADVYRAYDPVLKYERALKVVRTAGASPTELVGFRTEAERAAALDHPNITPVLGFDDSGRVPYLVMPLLAVHDHGDRDRSPSAEGARSGSR